jgi:hypothetical protein
MSKSCQFGSHWLSRVPSKGIRRGVETGFRDDIFTLGWTAPWDVHLWRFNDDALAFVMFVNFYFFYL